MQNFSRLRQKWKAELTNYLSPACQVLSRPVHKLIIEMSYGMLSSGSVKLSEIARSLKEGIDLHQTSKRLSRMLVKHDVSNALLSLVLSSAKTQLDEDTILAIDPGDLARQHAKHSEHIARVRDGSTGEQVLGYPLISVVARNKNNKTIPMFLRLYSSKAKGFESENTEILNAMQQVSEVVGKSFLWVMDRGGDRSILWDKWIAHGYNIVVRVTKQRHWHWRNQTLNAQEIAKTLPCKHTCKLLKHKDKEVNFGITTVRLSTHPYHPLTMVVVRHGKQEPLVLVSTKIARGKRQGTALVQAYMNRWSVEEGYRFFKDCFDLEGMMARKFRVMQNLVSLALLSWSFLASKEADACALKELGKADRRRSKERDKRRKKTIKFSYYSIIKGWKILFSLAHKAMRNLLRTPRKEQEHNQICMMFLRKDGLCV